jgi:hypothetical protein
MRKSMKNQRLYGAFTAVVIAALVGVTAGPALAASPADDTSARTDNSALQELHELSAAIPQQPLWDAAKAATERSAAQDAQSTGADTSGYSRTCIRSSYGEEQWDVQKATSCDGTLTFYYHGVSQGHMNMTLFVASQPERATDQEHYEAAQQLCSDNSLTCTVAVGIFLLPITVVIGILQSPSS